MKANSLIERKILENSGVKTNYRSDIDGKVHYIRGILIGQNANSYLIEGYKYGDIVIVPKDKLVSMFFEKSKDQAKPEITPDPITETRSKKKEVFSYSNWWKNANVQEAKE